MIRFKCSHCGRSLVARDEHAAKKAKCACGHVVQIPGQRASASAPAKIVSVAPPKSVLQQGRLPERANRLLLYVVLGTMALIVAVGLAITLYFVFSPVRPSFKERERPPVEKGAPEAEQIDASTLKVPPPEGGWPSGASIRVSLLSSDCVGKVPHAQIAFTYKEFETILVLKAINQKMSDDLGCPGRFEFGEFDVIILKTAAGIWEGVVCAKQYVKDPSGETTYVGAFMEFINASNWCNEKGEAILPVEDDYFLGPGEAFIEVCERQPEKDTTVVESHRLQLRSLTKSAVPAGEAVAPYP